MATKTEKAGNWPIPADAIKAFRERKKDRGITVVRSIRDALEFALRPECRKLWF